jgi:hypothetical protein
MSPEQIILTISQLRNWVVNTEDVKQIIADNRTLVKSMKSKKHQIIIPDDYRMLRLGEIRVSGDQYLLGKKWKPCNGIGVSVKEMDHPVIRKLDNSKANTSDETRAKRVGSG